METIKIDLLVTKRKFLRRIGLIFRNIERKNPNISIEAQTRVLTKKLDEIETIENDVLSEFFLDTKDYSLKGKIIYYSQKFKVEYEIKLNKNNNYQLPIINKVKDIYILYKKKEKIRKIFQQASRGLFVF